MTTVRPLPDTVQKNKARIESDLAHRNVSVRGLPYYYHIHLHMPCNQRCIMCIPSGRHPDTSLPYNEFVALFEQVRPYAEHITLIGGEPLLYPRIGDVLGLLSKASVAVSINTNATTLDDTLSEQLLELSELHLKCSIDAASRETYRRIRGTDRFDKVVANIKRVASEARELTRIKVIAVYVVMRENLDEVLPFIELFAGNGLERIEFHPVRHVEEWVVENRTGWTFRGKEQVCESFRQEYNTKMAEARQLGARYNLDIETHPMPETPAECF